jgi:hypothetical protein
LGTVLGDWVADAGLGYEGGAFCSPPDWRRYQRPISGPTFRGQGGPAFSRPIASLVVAVLMIASILVLPQRAGGHPQRA